MRSRRTLRTPGGVITLFLSCHFNYCSVFIKWNLMFAQEPSLQMKLIVSLMEPVWIKTSFVLIVISLQHYDCISLCIFSLILFWQQRACVGRDPPRLVSLYRLTTGPGHWPVWAAHGHWHPGPDLCTLVTITTTSCTRQRGLM